MLPACTNPELCSLVRETLVAMEQEPLVTCGGQWPCSSFLENIRELHRSLTPDKTDIIFEMLSRFSEDGSIPIRLDEDSLSELPFRCPEIHADVYQPCTVKSCSFYTHLPWSKNCILYYRLKRKVDVLGVTELAFILGKSQKDVRSHITAAMKAARQAALKETISQQVDHVVSRIEPSNVCVVCETKVDRPLARTNKYVYCSDKCYIGKPPYVVKIEKEFRLSITRVLAVCLDNFRTAKVIAQALGVTPAKLIRICERYAIEIPT